MTRCNRCNGPRRSSLQLAENGPPEGVPRGCAEGPRLTHRQKHFVGGHVGEFLLREPASRSFGDARPVVSGRQFCQRWFEPLVDLDLVAGDQLVGFVRHADDGLKFMEHGVGHAFAAR